MSGQIIAENGIDEQKKKRRRIIALLVVILIVLLIVLVFLLTRAKKRDIVTEDNAEEVAQEMIDREYVEPGYYEVSMETQWHFASGSAVSDNAWVENVENNTNDVYFDLFLAEDENNAIYESPVIPRGTTLNDIKLEQPLEKGEHECLVVYHLVDDDQETVSTLRVAITVSVDS